MPAQSKRPHPKDPVKRRPTPLPLFVTAYFHLLLLFFSDNANRSVHGFLSPQSSIFKSHRFEKVHKFHHSSSPLIISRNDGIFRRDKNRSRESFRQNLAASDSRRFEKEGDAIHPSTPTTEKKPKRSSSTSLPSSNISQSSSRRSFLSSSILLPSLLSPLMSSNRAAHARGLVQFPINYVLGNTYHFMRAGESLREEENILVTNPLFVTNRESALSEVGRAKVLKACDCMKEKREAPTVVNHSLAANSIDSANVIGAELKIGRDKIFPEFTFMDPRAIGGWDMSPLSTTQPAVWAMDVDEAGDEGKGGRPPPNDDGTPNDELCDLRVRLVQLLSNLETLYSGDTILLIFPDGTAPAVLTAMIAGIPFNRAHELEFQPGEIRLNVTMESVLNYLPAEPSQEYIEKIQRGRDTLKKLRENPDDNIRIDDLRYEMERKAEEEQALIRKEEQELKNKIEQDKKDAVIREVEQKEKEKKKMMEERERVRVEKKQKYISDRKEREKQNALVINESKSLNGSAAPVSDSPGMNPVVAGVLACGLVGALAFGGEEEIDEGSNIIHAINETDTNDDDLISKPKNGESIAEANSTSDNMIDDDGDTLKNISQNTLDGMTSVNNTQNNIPSPMNNTTVQEVDDLNESNQQSTTLEKQDSVLSTGGNPYESAEPIAETLQNSVLSTGGDLYESVEPSLETFSLEPDEEIFISPKELAAKAMDEYMDQDDGGDAWLGFLSDIVNEEEEIFEEVNGLKNTDI